MKFQIAPAVTALWKRDAAESPGASRDRQAARTSVASIAGRGVQLLAILVTVPLTVNYLGPERYGVWVTITSVLALLNFADLGIGNGLLNAVAYAHGLGDRELAKRYVSSGCVLLGAVALTLGLMFAAVFPFVDWGAVFHVSSPAVAAEIRPALAILIACFLVGIPLGAIRQIQFGYQEGYVASGWTALGSVFAIVAVLLVVRVEAGLPWLVFATAGTPLIALAMNGAALFGVRRRWLRPDWRLTDRAAVRRILSAGVLFVIIQLAVGLAYSTDNLIAAHVLGPDAVAQFAIPGQLFNIPTVILGLLLQPLWPAYGEAVASGDVRWVKRTLERSIQRTLMLSVVAAAFLVLTGPWLIELWVGSHITPTFGLLLGFGVWMVVSGLGSASAMFMNGVNALRLQAITGIVMAPLNILLSIQLAERYGVAGLIWGTVVTYVIIVGIPTVLYIPRLLASDRLLGPSVRVLSHSSEPA